MLNLLIIDRHGREHAIMATVGRSLMQTIRAAPAFDLAAICGGSLCCATCHVQIDAHWIDKLPPPTEDEQYLIGELVHQAAGSRLSCQIAMSEGLDGLRLTIAPEEW